MSEICKTKFQIAVAKQPEGWWNFGICLAHDTVETYIFINFYKWSISIGKLFDASNVEVYWNE